MPSYQYLRDIKPDEVKPPPPPEYSKQDKAKNWWQYHRVWVALGLVLAVVVGYFIYGQVTRVNPDLTLGIVAPGDLPGELVEKLEQGLVPYVEDWNGDGRVAVSVEVYTVASSSSGIADVSGSAGLEAYSVQGAGQTEDAYAQMAGVVRLSSAFEIGEVMVFMCVGDGAQFYQDQYGIFALPDGTAAPEGTDAEELTVRFGSQAGLEALDLTFTMSLYEDIEFDGQKILQDYRLGIRALHDTALENKKEGRERWSNGKAFLENIKTVRQAAEDGAAAAD